MTREAAVGSICRLAEGRILEWGGLRPFPAHEVPGCLGAAQARGWLRFARGHAAYHVYRPVAGGAEVWLFMFDDRHVHLVEIFSLPETIEVEPLLGQLGGPHLQLEYPLAAELQRPLQGTHDALSEWVFAERGLALLLGYAPQLPPQLVRVRGFEVMPAQEYRQRFVELPRVRFFPESEDR